MIVYASSPFDLLIISEIFTLESASVNLAITFGIFLCAIAILPILSSGSEQFGKFTEFRILPFSR